MMSNEDEKRCPLCAEEMDWTDQQLKPCKCGYQVCVWCWHQIMDMAEKDETEGRCPACRTPYDKDKIVGMEAKFERVSNNANRKHKPPKAKPKTNEGRKDLTNVRVIQRKMAYVIGLPLSLADEDLLQRKEFFGQYGKVTKISLSRTAGGAVQQFVHDTCSVYITYSKEEEAIRCIQSVHGFLLEGKFLRASFGTAKYCHAWLRNMPCNNPACLYLHSVGADEDSFGKDEVAAVHTRSRVQQIVGATHNLHKRSGNVLPLPVDEHINYSSASSDKPIFKSGLQDVAPDLVTSSGYLTCLPSSKDKDEGVRAPTKMTTFVDIVGRSYISDPDKEGNVAEDRSVVNSSSDLPLVGIQNDNYAEAEHMDAVPCQFSSSSLIADGLPWNKDFKEPFRESLNPLALGKADACGTKEDSSLVLDSGKQLLHGPCGVVREDLLSLDDIRLKDSGSLSQTACSPSSYPAKSLIDSSNHAWRQSHNLSEYIADPNTVNTDFDEASKQFTCADSANDGYNEKKFQSSAKADRIYRGSNSFSNEEIVEHLRRLDDDDITSDAQNPALDAVESSIISNIMSLDFDACDDLSSLRPNVAGLFNQTDGRHGSSWNLYNSDQSFSFTKQDGFMNLATDLGSSLGDIGRDIKNNSVPQDSVSRGQGLSPPGFSLPSREAPPGFPSCERTDLVFRATSGPMVKASSFSQNHYRTPSTGNSSNTSDADIIDPAILVVGRGKSANGLTNSCLDMSSNYASQLSALDDETRVWLLMQQSVSTPGHQERNFSQTYKQQAPATHLEMRFSNQIGDAYSSWDDIYGISSSFMDQHQTNNPSSFTQFSQQTFANGNISNGHQPGLDEVQQIRNEMGVAELHRNERLGYDKLYQGYGDYTFQMASSGDLYTKSIWDVTSLSLN